MAKVRGNFEGAAKATHATNWKIPPAVSASPSAEKREAGRIAALRAYGILDTAPEAAFDRIVDLAALMLDVTIALVSLIDTDRQWFKARCGLATTQTPRGIAFCDHAIRGSEIMVVEDATRDPRFSDNPLVVGEPAIRFYAGAPLINADGFALGTLCIIDTVPRTLDERQRKILLQLAAQVVHEFSVRAILGDTYFGVDVSRLTNRQIAESRSQYEALLNATGSAAMTIDKDGRIASWNLAAERIFGYSSELAIGLAVEDVVTSRPFSASAPSMDRSDANFHGSYGGMGKGGGAICIGRHMDGNEFPVDIAFATWTMQSGEIGVGAILRDATERYNREEELTRAQAHLADAQRIGQMGSWDWHLPTNDIKPSDEMNHLLGLPPGTRRSPAEAVQVIHEEDRAHWQEAMAQMAAGKKVPPVNYRMIMPDKSVRMFQSVGQIVHHSDGPHLIGVVMDITDRVRSEAERRENERLAALGELAGGVAHEMNNFLQPIISLSEMVSEDLAQPATPELLAGMTENLNIVMDYGRQAREIVRKILRYARHEAPTLTASNLGTALQEATNLVEELLSPGITLSTEVALETVDMALINPGELTQVIVNLAVNADHAMGGKGELKIRAERRSVSEPAATASGLKPGDYFVIRVADTGAGMDAATQLRIFDPFFTTKPIGQGTGLGLSMVQGILKSWHGDIAVESEVGIGTEFILHIPVAPGPAPAKSQGQASERTAHANTG